MDRNRVTSWMRALASVALGCAGVVGTLAMGTTKPPLAGAAVSPQSAALIAPVVGIAATPTGSGYWEVAADGGVFAYGTAGYYGSMGGRPLDAPIVGIAATPTGNGYWLAAADGGIFSFGAAAFHGSMGGRSLNAAVVGIAATPTGHGYWLVASDGGIFAFGAAHFYGSMGGQPLNEPVVGIAATDDGYWEVASDGGLFAYGTAGYYGSMGGQPLSAPVVGMASVASGTGYYEVASDGGVFAYGSAQFYGSMGGQPLNEPIVGLATAGDAGGYWENASDGGIFAFGAAPFEGSVPSPTATMAPVITTILGTVDPTLTQTPTNPLRITYTYSAKATTLTNGVPKHDKTLPTGVLQLFTPLGPNLPSGLACSIDVGGQVAGGKCAVTYQAVGTYKVTVTYVSGTTAATGSETVTFTPYTVSMSASDVSSGGGTTTAPDGATCTAGPAHGCQLMTATLSGHGTDAKTPPPGTVTFDIYDDTLEVIGTFATESAGQTYCLVNWIAYVTSIFATSPDCSGGVTSQRIGVIGFHFSGQFMAPGYTTAISGVEVPQ